MLTITAPDFKTADQAWLAISRHGGFDDVTIICTDTGRSTRISRTEGGGWSVLSSDGVVLRFG